VTASDRHRRPAHLFADLFVYLPIGVASEAIETVPRLVKRGRERTKLARLAGHVAVEKGQRKVEEIVRQVFDQGAPATSDPDAAGPAPNVAMPDVGLDDEEQPIVVRHLHAAYDLSEAALLAIPDYDSLSASQVVPRLAGLTTDELEAVRQYETAHRARRTILGRVAQLQQSA